MIRSIRSLYLAFGLILSITIVASEGDAQIVQHILKKIDRHAKTLITLKAGVRMDTFYSQLDEHDIWQGNIVYFQGQMPNKGINGFFRIDWTRPTKESLAVVNGQYVLYRPNLGQAYTGSIDAVRKNLSTNSLLAFLNMSKKEIKANYELGYAGTAKIDNRMKVWHLTIKPTMKVSYKSVDIWVDKRGMPIQLKQTEYNNDSMTILFSELKKNSKVGTKEVQVNVPKGTKIIKG